MYWVCGVLKFLHQTHALQTIELMNGLFTHEQLVHAYLVLSPPLAPASQSVETR
jgi:hypothetical protein